MWLQFKLILKAYQRHMSVVGMASSISISMLGFFILIFTINANNDFGSLLEQKQQSLAQKVVVINKPVSVINTLTNKSSSFSEYDIKELEEQDFCTAVFPFQAAYFPIKASAGGREGLPKFYTDLFFESLNNQCLDVAVEEWEWEPGNETLPIIIPQDYLNLYNFGFATTQNLPQITEGLASSIRFDVFVGSGNHRVKLEGKIVGYSQTINSILVPESFMNWANKTYGTPNEKPRPTRLALLCEDLADEQMFGFFQKNNYETDRDNIAAGESSFYLKVVLGVVGLIGILLVVAALYMMFLSNQLIVQKCKDELVNLHLLGFSDAQISAPIIVVNAMLVGASLVGATLLSAITITRLNDFLTDFGISSMGGSSSQMLLVPALALLVTLLILTISTRLAVVNARK
ncbi:MAG: hypothetical protein ACI8ZN_001921 [Bacteroidia bacterium]|jgi:hypothetical protein